MGRGLVKRQHCRPAPNAPLSLYQGSTASWRLVTQKSRHDNILAWSSLAARPKSCALLADLRPQVRPGGRPLQQSLLQDLHVCASTRCCRNPTNLASVSEELSLSLSLSGSLSHTPTFSFSLPLSLAPGDSDPPRELQCKFPKFPARTKRPVRRAATRFE